jgi:hypothetical protein
MITKILFECQENDYFCRDDNCQHFT